MWLLQNPKDGYYLTSIDENRKVHTVKEKSAAKTFDNQDQAEGFALALNQLTGTYLESKNKDDQ